MPASRNTCTGTPVSSPNSSQACSACDPRLGPRAVGLGRGRLIDPAALLVAIDPDGREIADPFERGELRDLLAVMLEHRIAFRPRRDRMQQMRRAVQHLGKRAVSGLAGVLGDLVAALGKMTDLAHVARGSGDLPALGGKPLRQGLRREAEAEAEQPAHAASPIHSLLTAGSGSSACTRAQGPEALRRQTRQRPHRHGAHQRRSVVEPRLDQRHERRIAGIAGGDQHIAQEAVAAGALDRRAAEARAERGIVEEQQLGERRVVAFGSHARASPRARFARICSTGRRRGNRRSRRCGCPSPRGSAARYVPYARW